MIGRSVLDDWCWHCLHQKNSKRARSMVSEETMINLPCHRTKSFFCIVSPCCICSLQLSVYFFLKHTEVQVCYSGHSDACFIHLWNEKLLCCKFLSIVLYYLFLLYYLQKSFSKTMMNLIDINLLPNPWLKERCVMSWSIIRNVADVFVVHNNILS